MDLTYLQDLLLGFRFEASTKVPSEKNYKYENENQEQTARAERRTDEDRIGFVVACTRGYGPPSRDPSRPVSCLYALVLTKIQTRK